MIRFSFILVAILFFLHTKGACQKYSLKKKDFQTEWLLPSSDKYISYDQSEIPATTIYFLLNPAAYRGDYLQIKSTGSFTVFVNQQLLINAEDSAKILIDSLPQTGTMLLGVNRKEKITAHTLSTCIYTDISMETTHSETTQIFKKATFFRDFVVTAALFLFVFFILMIQLNPRLSSDYFSVNRIFSLRETDDDQFYKRITSANILFYIFTSLVLGLFFLTGHEFIGPWGDSAGLDISSFGTALIAWFKLSLIILIALFLKIVLVFVLSVLFDSSDAAGFHFFNFVRVVLVVTTLLTLLQVGYFILRGANDSFYDFLFGSFGWVTGLWIIILFFKLSYRVRFSPIHLFSYICATEIIPFLIIIKILYE